MFRIDTLCAARVVRPGKITEIAKRVSGELSESQDMYNIRIWDLKIEEALLEK